MKRREFLRGGFLALVGVGTWEGMKAILPQPQKALCGVNLNFDDSETTYYALHMSAPDGWHIWMLEENEREVMRTVNEPWLPCGNHNNFASINDIPLYDVPCPCGKPNHWLVKCVTTVKDMPQP